MGVYENDSDGLRIIGYNTPIRFYDTARTLRAEIYLKPDNTLNVGGLISSGGITTPATSHSTLSGLGDDDHIQYILKNGTRTLTGNWDAGAFEITADGLQSDTTLEVTGQSLFGDKIKFTQTDGNEAIDSLNDGYMDYLATTGHRFNADTTVTGTFNATNAIQLNGTSINTGGTLANVAYLDQANVFTAKQSVLLTTEQLRLSYDATNYATFTVADDGALTFTTVDADAALANIIFAPDGNVVVNALLNTGAGRIVNTTRVTTTYTILVTDHTVFCDSDGGDFTVTLPAGVEGQYLRIINCGSSGYTVTIDGNGAETVRGDATQDLADGEILVLVYNSTEGWF